jgi:hypothetical protein
MNFVLVWLWLFASLLPLLALERWIHRHMQGIGLLVTRDADLATIVYSAIFLPGVALHECSHWLMAKLLGVQTARMSLWPSRQSDGTLRLGFVETAKVDFVREALIGVAPLLTGSGVVVLIGYSRLAIGPLGSAIASGDIAQMSVKFLESLRSADAFIWLYLLFAVSNSMMPSASDRRAWLPVTVVLALIGVALYYIGVAPQVVESVGDSVAGAVRVVASAFSITIGVNLVIIPIIWIIENALIRLTGLKINY